MCVENIWCVGCTFCWSQEIILKVFLKTCVCIITFLCYFLWVYKKSNQNDKLKIYFKLTHNIDIYLFSYEAMILNSIMVSMFHHFGDLVQSFFFFFTFFSSNIRLYYILCIRYRVFAPWIFLQYYIYTGTSFINTTIILTQSRNGE